METKKKIIFIGGHRFDYHPGGTYHLARQFAKAGYEVAFISYFLSPFHLIFAYDKRELPKRLSVWLKGGEWFDNKKIWSYTPFTLLPIYDKPVLRSCWVIENTYRLTFPRFMKVLKKHGFHDVDIVWLDSTLYGFVLDIISHKKNILRLIDDSRFLHPTPDNFLKKDKDVIERADVVISYSHDLIGKYEEITNKELIYLPNAVDIDFFLTGSKEMPEEYKHIPPPRIICLGGINKPPHFDSNLMVYAAQKLPEASFVFIGEPFSDVTEISKLQNTYILGHRPYQKIPQYLKNADVGIIPYKLSPLTDRYGADLLKLYEYSACGLPVVSLKFKEFYNVETVAYLAKNYVEFVHMLKAAIQKKERNEFLEYAKANSWEKRFKELIALF